MFAGSVEHYSFGPLVEFWLLPSSFLMKEGHVMLLVIGTIFFFSNQLGFNYLVEFQLEVELI